jgi:hypothetical protein
MHPSNNQISACGVLIRESQAGASASVNGSNARKIHDPLHQSIPVYLG